ncbi:MAG: ribonuclease III [Clostridia bacterium]|nr:ribonuclease III [Clostridia bacterium]
MDQNFIRSLSGATLAYLGDAVLEVMVRRYLVGLGIADGGKLSQLALNFVRATAQSAAMNRMLPHLTEDEAYIFKRGRNAHGISIPHSASAAEYRRATGMEALFGWLDLNGQQARAEELFALAYSDVIERLNNEKLAKECDHDQSYVRLRHPSRSH